MRLSVWVVLALAGCEPLPILGGPTPATTSHVCPDGLACPNGYDCPPLAGGRCESPDLPPPMQWERRADAGQIREAR